VNSFQTATGTDKTRERNVLQRTRGTSYYAPPLGLSDDARLTSVCRVHRV